MIGWKSGGNIFLTDGRRNEENKMTAIWLQKILTWNCPARVIRKTIPLKPALFSTLSKRLLTHSPDVSGSDWSIASFLVPCQLTRFSRPEELCSPGFLSCSCLGTCALYQYLLSSIRSRISVASGWTRSPQVSHSGWITKSINTTWGRRNTGGL